MRLQVKSTNSSYATYGYKQTSKIDGSSLSAASFDMRDTNTWKTFGERTITVSHNSDGSYSSSKSGSFTTTASGSYSLKSGSCSVTVNPSTIPRASEPSLNTSLINAGTVSGQNILHIYINRKSSSFTHTVELKVRNYTATFYNVSTEAQWDSYNIWAGLPTYYNTQDGTITVTTYNGNTYIGTKSVNFKVYINPNDCMPLLQLGDFTPDSRTYELTGNYNTIIKNFSTVDFNGYATTKKYSTIYQVTGTVANEQPVQANTSVVSTEGENTLYSYSGTLRQIKDNNFIIKATDNRGLSTTDSYQFTYFKEYTNISLNSLIAKRLNRHNGTEDITGTATSLSFSGTLWNENFGTVLNSIKSISCQFKIKTEDESQYSDILKLNGNPINTNDVIIENDGTFSISDLNIKGDILEDDSESGVFAGFKIENSYDIKLIIQDEISETVLYTTLDAGKPYIEVTDGENGEGLIDFKVPIKFNKATGPQKILWQGAWFMADDQSINLPEAISEQNNGIILIFSGYSTNTWEEKDYNWNSHFISKKEIEILPNSEHIFFMGGTEGLSGFKYINIQNNALHGHSVNTLEKNDDYGRYKNTDFVLRYVLGV